MSHPIDNYINYKNENVAIYTKKEFENKNIYVIINKNISFIINKIRRSLFYNDNIRDRSRNSNSRLWNNRI